eukprot:CAMPEP_0172487114 /NCGR_PEP_ID=MMETSP1066-20121228/16019_1 /TAXON_ID=671091 /ORGANISM="Coscinodiscus wailesii, Strain CCMP2513" /LENGTH=43 /DNA_ID= /DNA_START= /DNA_END= /DNA_ORIENTATION=
MIQLEVIKLEVTNLMSGQGLIGQVLRFGAGAKGGITTGHVGSG